MKARKQLPQAGKETHIPNGTSNALCGLPYLWKTKRGDKELAVVKFPSRATCKNCLSIWDEIRKAR